MQKLTIFFVLLTCICCTNPTKEHSPSYITGDNFSDSITNEYHRILNGLKHDYVLNYRNIKECSNDLKTWGLPENDSIVKVDSVIYWESYQSFFRLDSTFIGWLLTFKNDSTKSGLWRMYLSPLSSHISECNQGLSNSRAAIILIENFLNGNGIECYECAVEDRQECNLDKYREIENFLNINKGKHMDQLRLAWKIKNAR
jgi:hypothetical protein